MATAGGPIKKMFDFMRNKKSQAIVDTDLITESGHLESGDEHHVATNPAEPSEHRYGGEKNKPIVGDYVQMSKRRAKDDAVRLKHKGYKSDDHGVYSVYKAKKYRHAQKKRV